MKKILIILSICFVFITVADCYAEAMGKRYIDRGIYVSTYSININYDAEITSAYISKDNSKEIVGVFNGMEQKILSSDMIEDRRNFVGDRFPVPGRFSKVILSPKKKYLLFYISAKGALDPGYIGILNLTTGIVHHLNINNSVPKSWSPDGKYLALLLHFDGMEVHNTIFLYETDTSRIRGPLFTEEFYENWGEVDYVYEIEWKNAKELVFKARRTEYNPETKKAEILNIGIWEVNLDTTSIQNSNLKNIK